MRCFVSIELPGALKRDIDGAVGLLREGKPDVKWVSAENLHITLKFLGETAEDTVRRLEEEFSAVAGRHSSFRLGLRGMGLFPDDRRPRVVWIDITDTEELRKLQEEVEERAISNGYKKEDRPFSPHLTIGRVRSFARKDYLLGAMEAIKQKDFGNIEVSAFSLMKSDLKPAGAQYTKLSEFHLNRRSYDE